MSTEAIRFIRDGEKGGRGYGGWEGGGGRNYICIKVGSDDSHFNVSLIVRD